MDRWNRVLHSPLLVFVAAIGIALFLYWPVLDAYVLGDDILVLMNGIHTKLMLKTWHGDWFARSLSNEVSLFYRPITTTSIWLETRLWGNWAPGFHLTNIILHGLCSGLVFLLARSLAPDQHKYWIGHVAGLIFLFHPRHCEAIAPICSRQDILATFWILTTACLHVTALQHSGKRASTFRATALLSYGLALLSKETALAAPLLFIWLEWLFGGTESERLISTFKRTAIRTSGYIFLMAGYLCLRAYFLGQLLGRADYVGGIPSLEVAGGSFLKVIASLLLVVPVNLLPAWTFLYAKGTAAGLITLATLALLAPFLMLIVGHYKTGWRLPAFGISIWLGLFIPALSIGGDPRTTAGDHHMYMASVGMAIAVASFCLLCTHQWSKYVIAFLIIVYCCVSIFGLQKQTHVWQSVGQLAQSTLQKVENEIDRTPPGTPIVLVAAPHYVKFDRYFIDVFNFTEQYIWFLNYPDRIKDFYFASLTEIHDLERVHVDWNQVDSNTLNGTIKRGYFIHATPFMISPSTTVTMAEREAREVQITFQDSTGWVLIE